MQRALRSHQQLLAGVVEAIARGETGIADILAAVTPGGGKSLLPVIAAARLMAAGIVERVCWIVPRDSLRLQAEEAFADPAWRAALGHAVSVRAAENAPDPCRGLQGWITTYQGVAAAPGLHLAEMRRHRTLLVVDEVHHLPAEADPSAPEEAAWSRAILPLLETAAVRLLLSGTLERADGRPILWLPYRKGPGGTAGGRAKTREVDLAAPGFAVIGYSRAQALAEKAVLPVDFGALDGEAEWLDEERRRTGPHPVSGPPETGRAALFTALRTGFARDLLRRAFAATRDLRAERRVRLGLPPGETGMGLGKLLVVAPDQENARRYLEWVRAWLPRGQAESTARIATSDERDAQEVLAAFRLRPEPSVLVTVAMAYEGLDAPSVAVCAALTHIRSRAWLEQMIARATRVDFAAGPYESQRAVVLHPDDLLFRRFRERIEREQGTLAREKARRRQGELPIGPEFAQEPPIIPLASNATALHWHRLAPGPEFAAARPDPEAAAPAVPPSARERELRFRISQAVAAQVLEDEGAMQVPRRAGAHHAYAAALKRVMGKGRAEMSLAELEATLAWLERNRIGEHLHLLAGDPRYGWTVRQRRFDFRTGR
ncbi:DEAD/DEAH box helicase [Roseicella frigidaeris]|uniref:Restriction endonuclease subunit R n=1 Tax=Roseicella frigidaeris TaxID=2230885 RepID=A0A327M762_9PROT|nr:DEAD/DEAH box helicase family protein [Roseicella frigidaeris]RAI58176.1 restriction endonuclease subunit R [Roseicella frigidaeris]